MIRNPKMKCGSIRGCILSTFKKIRTSTIIIGGVGLEYRFNSVASATIGNFKNSDNDRSSYAGIYYQPIAIGPVKLGLVAGGFNGYQSTNNGGWFPAVLPAITIEEGRFGANIFFIPTVGDKVNGAISLQLKVKLYD